MTTIKDLLEQITEELDDACYYIKWALHSKDSENGLSKLFYQLSDEELDHANRLHDSLQKYINEQDDITESDKTLIEYIRSRQIDKMKDIRTYQSVYK